MKAVKSRDTMPEVRVLRAVRKLKLRFSTHSKLPGRPDLVLRDLNVAVFVNGCFWHGHAGCRRAAPPKSNVEFWTKKISGNVKRDERNYRKLRRLGWSVFLLWECKLKTADKAEAELRRRLLRLPRNFGAAGEKAKVSRLATECDD